MFSLIDLALITCPKYWHFLFFIIGNDDLVVFAIFKTSSLVLCSVHTPYSQMADTREKTGA